MANYFDRLSPKDRAKLPGLPPERANFPSTLTFGGPGVICEYDLIVLNRTALPLAGPPEGGTALDVDRQKAPGSDWAKIIGRGYDVVPMKFTLLLWRCVLTGMDWLQLYDDRVCDALMPRRLDKRNAVELYHPAYARENIHSIVVERKPVVKHVGKQFFHVEVEGIDIRRVSLTSEGKGKSASKAMKNDVGLQSKGTALGKAAVGPTQQATGKP